MLLGQIGAKNLTKTLVIRFSFEFNFFFLFSSEYRLLAGNRVKSQSFHHCGGKFFPEIMYRGLLLFSPLYVSSFLLLINANYFFLFTFVVMVIIVFLLLVPLNNCFLDSNYNIASFILLIIASFYC
jgi:hypothetical protein